MQETIFPQIFSWKNSTSAPSAFLLSASTLQNLCLGQFLPVLPHIPKQYAVGPYSRRPGGTCVLFLELFPSAHASWVKKEKKPYMALEKAKVIISRGQWLFLWLPLYFWPLFCCSLPLFPGDETSFSNNIQAHTHIWMHTSSPDTLCQIEKRDQEKGRWFGWAPSMYTCRAGSSEARAVAGVNLVF